MGGPATGPIVDGPNGIVLPLVLNGDNAGEAVYTVPIVIGHRGGMPWTGGVGPQGKSSAANSASSTGASSRSDAVGTYTGTSLFPGPQSSTASDGTASLNAGSTITSNNGLFGTSIVASSTLPGGVSTDASETGAQGTGTGPTPTQPARRQRERSGRTGGDRAYGMARRAEVLASDYQTMNVQVDLGSSDLVRPGVLQRGDEG